MNLIYRQPIHLDGTAVHALIKRCPPLDENSIYCNLLQCRDFAETSILVQTDQGEVVGFVSGYIPPNRPKTLFIWQVALDKNYRGKGIAIEMLSRLFSRNSQSLYVETTISPSNQASQSLFQRFFAKHHMPYESSVLFERDVHFLGEHEDEVLYVAGPAKQFSPIHAA